MSKEITTSIGFKIEDAGGGFKQLSIDAATLQEEAQSDADTSFSVGREES